MKTSVMFPNYRKELIALGEEDQKQLRGNMHRISLIKNETVKQKEHDKLVLKCHIRAKRMLEILDEIKAPNINNIGVDGCEAVLLITQHSYLSVMKQVLKMFEKEFEKDPKRVPITYLPSLMDRIMVLETRKQKYGTQWTTSKNNIPFLVPVEDFDNVNKRRAEYGLKPVNKPVNLAIGAVKYPLGKGLASASDQKKLTDAEYKRMSRNYLKSMV